MNQDIKKILEELYALDKKLQQREPELVKSLEYLLAARPEAKVDKKFARQLRAQLIKQARQASVPKQSIFNIFNLTIMNKIAFAAGGAALALIIAIPLLSYNKGGQKTIQSSADNAGFVPEIERVGELAFGSLSETGSAGEQAFGLGSADLSQAVQPTVEPLADSASAAPAVESAPKLDPTTAVARGLGGGGGIAQADTMIYVPIHYDYVYTGDDLTLEDQKLPVLKRVKNGQAGSSLAQILGNFGGDTLNLSKFGNKSVENITIAEEKPYGYMVYYNITDGMVSISMNWRQWPTVDYSQRLDMNGMPADEEVIAIADRFMDEYGIPLEGYAQPEVRKDWLPYYESLADKSEFYIEEAQVVYPELINGQVVYDQSGQPSGLNVSVSLRHKRVTNLNNLITRQYQSSDYPAVTDTKKILDIAKNGSMYPQYRMEGAETKEIRLDTPTRQLVKFYKYDNGVSHELLAPALIFPVIDKPEQGFYQQNVVIPLVADLLPDNQPMPEPMPIRIMEEAR